VCAAIWHLGTYNRWSVYVKAKSLLSCLRMYESHRLAQAKFNVDKILCSFFLSKLFHQFRKSPIGLMVTVYVFLGKGPGFQIEGEHFKSETLHIRIFLTGRVFPKIWHSIRAKASVVELCCCVWFWIVFIGAPEVIVGAKAYHWERRRMTPTAHCEASGEKVGI